MYSCFNSEARRFKKFILKVGQFGIDQEDNDLIGYDCVDRMEENLFMSSQNLRKFSKELKLVFLRKVMINICP